MGNNLSDIVNISISLDSPPVDSSSFDNLLIVGLPPVAEVDLPDVGVYSDLSEVIEAGYVAIGNSADPVGIAARIAFSQIPKPSKIYIAAMKETETEVLEPPTDTLQRALDTDGWYVVCPAGIDAAMYEQIAEWTEAQTKMFAYTFLSKTDPVSDIYYRSQGWCGLESDEQLEKDVSEANRYLHVAAVSKILSYPAGSETWANQVLAAVFPSKLSGMLKKALSDGNSNFFARYSGKNITMRGRVRAGEWIDIIRGRDWLQNDMQIGIYTLKVVQPKISFGDSGIGQIHNAILTSLKTAQTRGIIAEDEYDEDKNLIPGFTVSVPLSASIPPAEKASRVLSGCRFTARPAGAIHVTNVNGSLAY